jgi:hypothetical protein
MTAKARHVNGSKRDQMAVDDEDLPVRYLLYVAAALVLIAGVAVSSFFFFAQ